MHTYECTNKGTQTQDNNNTEKQDYILSLFALFI